MAEQPTIAITIGRQLGAGGAALGQRLARRLGFDYLDREVLRLAAERVGVSLGDLTPWDERLSCFRDRVFEVFSFGPPDGIYTPPPRTPLVRDQELFTVETQLIQEIADERSVVIIGRGGSWMLRDHPGLVRVFLHAPPIHRVPEVMKGYGLNGQQEALDMIERIDRERERFIREMTGQTVTDTRNYDLCIETHRVGLDAAEEMVVTLVEQTRQRLAAPRPEQPGEAPQGTGPA